MGHGIKYGRADLDFDFLLGPFSGLESRANDALKSSHCRFDQRPPMIAIVHRVASDRRDTNPTRPLRPATTSGYRERSRSWWI